MEIAREGERLDAGSGLNLKLAGPQIVQFPQSASPAPQPLPAKVESAPTKQSRDPFAASNLTRISLIVGVGLAIALFVWASGYVIRCAHLEIGLPNPATVTSAESPAPSPALSVTADMLHVTSIALGKGRLAVVNGEPLKEGDSLTVKTPAGGTTVCLTRIKDGIVRFEYRGRIIDVPLTRSAASKSAAH